MRDVVLERNAGLADITRVVVQWGHCSQAVGAGEVHRRLAQLFQGRDDVAVVAAGCDGACFAATQVVVELPDGTARFFDRVGGDGDISQRSLRLRTEARLSMLVPGPIWKSFSRLSTSP